MDVLMVALWDERWGAKSAVLMAERRAAKMAGLLAATTDELVEMKVGKRAVKLDKKRVDV